MTKREFLFKMLFDNGILTGTNLVDLYYENCDEEVEKKRAYYIGKNEPKTEKELRVQIKAELQSEPYHKNNKGLINIEKVDGKTQYSLTEEGKNVYLTNYCENEIVNEISDEVVVDVVDVDVVDGENDNGIVYLLRSKLFTDTYKIGITKTTIEQRVESLKRDNRYGTFKLKPVMYMQCSDISIIEIVLHKFFENYRICKKNDVGVDTELFKGLDTIEQEFELFATTFLMANPRYKATKLIKN